MNSLQRELQYNQIHAKKYIVYKFCNGDHGIGSEFHMMIPSLSMAFHTGRAFTVQGNWIFAGNNPFSYWFKPTQNQPNMKTAQKYRDNIDSIDVITIDPMTSYTTINEKYGQPPDKYQHKGIIWWKGQLLGFLMQPNQRLLKAIHNAIDIPQPFIGLQIRHSNNWTSKTRKNIPLETYMKHINKISSETGINTIFISTEDQNVINDCKKFPQYKFYFTRNQRTNQNQAKAIIAGRLDGAEEGRIGLINLFLMRKAKHFVGGFQSNWGRLILEHMHAIDNIPKHCYSLERIPIERYKPGSIKQMEFSEFNRYSV